eukprot:TRINITY_DN32935_c0_g1_i1.p1 TRINITY_DN32935_c0_g1~~TRINITY_DN32935_c0_g1_i1.p1  ORF type:complete len:410 (+),score=139.10 TRINITY_DN32935_c0_g1_i1:65-1294(+)
MARQERRGSKSRLHQAQQDSTWLPLRLRSVAEKQAATEIMQKVGMWDDKDGRYYTRERQQQATMKYFHEERLVLKYSPRGHYGQQQTDSLDNSRIPTPRAAPQQRGRKSALASASFDPSTITDDMIVGELGRQQLEDMRRGHPLLRHSPVLSAAKGLNGARLDFACGAGRSAIAARNKRQPLGSLSGGGMAGFGEHRDSLPQRLLSISSENAPAEPAAAEQSSVAPAAVEPCGDAPAAEPPSALSANTGEIVATVSAALEDAAAGRPGPTLQARAAIAMASPPSASPVPGRSMPPLPKIEKHGNEWSSPEYSSLMMQLRRTRRAVEEHGRSINTVKSLLEMQGTAELKRTITRIFADPKQATAISEAEWAKRHKQYEAERVRLHEQQQEELRDQREELAELAGRVQRLG